MVSVSPRVADDLWSQSLLLLPLTVVLGSYELLGSPVVLGHLGVKSPVGVDHLCFFVVVFLGVYCS